VEVDVAATQDDAEHGGTARRGRDKGGVIAGAKGDDQGWAIQARSGRIGASNGTLVSEAMTSCGWIALSPCNPSAEGAEKSGEFLGLCRSFGR
jgi:hypothetical protein